MQEAVAEAVAEVRTLPSRTYHSPRFRFSIFNWEVVVVLHLQEAIPILIVAHLQQRRAQHKSHKQCVQRAVVAERMVLSIVLLALAAQGVGGELA